VNFSAGIKRTRAREKTLFPNEASNYQLGGSSPLWPASSSIGVGEKGLGRDLPPEWFAQTLLP